MSIKKSIRNQLKRSELLRELARFIRSVKSRYFTKIFIIEGSEKTSQQLLTVLFSGSVNNMYYVIDKIFGDSGFQISESEVWNKNLWRSVQRKNARHDLAIIQADTAPLSIKSGNDSFQLPCWVGGVKDLHLGAELSRHCSQIKSDLRRIRINRLAYRVTNEEQEFERFYHEMYLPYMKNAYGDFAFLMSHEEMKAAIPRCQLFLVTRDGEDIAGGMHIYDESNQVRAWSIGVKDGDRNWVKIGALSALEYFETLYLLEKGYSHLHRGASRPFLNDGVLRFKLKRGMKITEHTKQSLVIIPLKNSSGVREFFQNNPFLYKDGETLKGAIFVSSDLPCNEEIERGLFKKWFASDEIGLNLFAVTGDENSAVFIKSCGGFVKLPHN